MIKVAYDNQIFSLQRYGGISRYFYELGRRVAAAENFYADVMAHPKTNEYLRNNALPVRGYYLKPVPRMRKFCNKINTLLSCAAMRNNKPDIIHETYYHGKSAIVPKGCPVVITVHDMIHEKFPEMFPKHDNTSAKKRRAVERADKIVCVSENTKRDLLEIFDVAEDIISVVYHGFEITENEEQQPCALSQRPYILYVGQREGYKNFKAFITAYAASETLHKDFDVIAFGSKDFNSEELLLLKTLGVDKRRVNHMTGSDTFLVALYRNAAMFVLPSIYEGFGIPPLEAMNFGCPVVCSNTSSIPEVVGEAAQLFEPTDVEKIRIAMEKVAYDKERRNNLIMLGKQRIKNFSWDRCAQETMECYKELVR